LKVAIIFNPSSGKGLGVATAAAVQRDLIGRGLDAELHPTHGPRHATHLARELAPSTDIIVVVGGDGTINEVVGGMAEAGDAAIATGGAKPGCRLGIVPAGTINVVALELKLPFGLKDACTVIAAGQSLPLDVGKVNDRRFVLMTGAVTIRNLDLRLKRRLRSLAFVGTGLTKGLAHPHPEFLVTVDGTTRRATFMVASNFRYYAAHLSMTPTADPTDGLLDIMLFHGTTKRTILGFWVRVPGRLHVRSRSVTTLRAKQAELALLEGSEPVWLQADGEIVGQLPATVQIEPAAIQVLVPWRAPGGAPIAPRPSRCD
jgi:diacylglycerol kinase (ATP)